MTMMNETAATVNADPTALHDDEDFSMWATGVHAASEPSEEDIADYTEWSRRLDEASWAARVAVGPTLIEKLYSLANALIDEDDADLRGLGTWIGRQADEARALDAKSWSEFLDRRDAMMAGAGR